MTEQKTIRWLSRAYWIGIRIAKMQEQRDVYARMIEGARGIDYARDITHGGVPATLEDAVLRLVDLDAKLAGEIQRYTAAVDEITEAIRLVEDERLSTLLYLRYVKGERWEQIAVAINYAWAQVHRLHHRALAAVREKMIHNDTVTHDNMLS